jgi:voltage-gated potassium channel
MYWATVTLTTVGYGDIAPKTSVGKAIASFMMLLGWGILAVPTGIVTAEMTIRRHDRRGATRVPAPMEAREQPCPGCGSAGHADGARFCKDCGAALPPQAQKR